VKPEVNVTRRRMAGWLALSPAWLGLRPAYALQTAGATPTKMPLIEGSMRFAVMGDTGRGDEGQYAMAAQMAKTHAAFPFTLMLMVGDNIYGADGPAEMQKKFDLPYKPLIDAGVTFQATTGNHDNPNQRFYKPFNMSGNLYYSFRPKGSDNVRFFALDSNYVDKLELAWLDKELAASASDWKVAYFHHPLYSSGGTHGSALETRAVLEPLFVKYGMSVVFSGHDHFYERMKPQTGGIVYWVTGGGGSLRKGDIRKSNMMAAGFDTDYSFMIVEISGDTLFFQAISRTGAVVDSGVIGRPGATAAAQAKVPAAAASPTKAPASDAVPVKPAAPATSPSPKPAPTPQPL
jgi:hypothetical protein